MSSVDFGDYWHKIITQNPSLSRGDSVIKLSSISFKRELLKAFRAGQQSHKPSGTKSDQGQGQGQGYTSNFPDTFKDLFGL